MAVRKALAYSKGHNRPYTRKSKSKSKSYIKVVPHNKIVKYTLGNHAAFNQGKFPYVLKLVAEENVLVRDIALEAGRMSLNKNLEKAIPNKFYLWVKVYPHHILRNNKTAAGAGADRISTGMTQSFGVVEGRAARVPRGKEIFMVACDNEQSVQTARKILHMVKAKVPCKTKITFERLQAQTLVVQQ